MQGGHTGFNFGERRDEKHWLTRDDRSEHHDLWRRRWLSVGARTKGDRGLDVEVRKRTGVMWHGFYISRRRLSVGALCWWGGVSVESRRRAISNARPAWDATPACMTLDRDYGEH